MGMRYPLLAIERSGFVQMIASSEYWKRLPSGFVNLYKRRLNVLKFYDKEGNRWQLNSIAPDQAIGLIRRFLGVHLGLSVQPVSVVVDLQLVGPYEIEELRGD